MNKYYTYTHRTIGPFIYLGADEEEGHAIKRLRDGHTYVGGITGECEPWTHPQPERLREMAGRFEERARNPHNRVDFSRSIAGTEPYSGCGTVACHAGWAGQVLGASNHYLSGARALGRFLCPWWGDVDGDDFPRWAYENPELWGNLHGRAMFTGGGYTAFGFEDDECGKCNLLDIAAHYRKVAERIEAIL